MKITLKDLRKHGACAEQVDLFKATFGKEIILTEALVMEYGTTFDLGWVARNLFPAPLYADYQAKRAPLFWSIAKDIPS
jgi:hypothetical protein